MKAGVGRRILTRLLMPVGVAETAYPLLAARALRAFGDGYVSLLLPVYLLSLGLAPFQVGIVATGTLLGSGVLTLLVGLNACTASVESTSRR